MCHKTQSLKAALIWNFLKPNRRTCVHQPASSNASDSPLSSETQNLNETESELFIQFLLNWILELLCSSTAHQPVRSNASDFSQTYDGDQTNFGGYTLLFRCDHCELVCTSQWYAREWIQIVQNREQQQMKVAKTRVIDPSLPGCGREVYANEVGAEFILKTHAPCEQ